MEQTLRILSITSVTHDVHCIRFEKPEGYKFTPGQATDVSINKDGWKDEKRPFTFTCLNEEPYLEFTIKSYSDHDGVTNQIGQLKIGDQLIIDDPWGAIEYKGPGYFIAGGAGITPFIAILRQLYKDGQLTGNKLFFSNKTAMDIIYQEELKKMLGEDALFIVTKEASNEYLHDYINETFFDKHVQDYSKQFYVCGPDAMVAGITGILTKKGADANNVVFEK